MRARLGVSLAVCALAASPAASAQSSELVPVPAGFYTPFQKVKAAASAEATAVEPVAAFGMDAEPVTNADFLAFVKSRPEWRRSNVKPLFADGRYLKRWASDLDPSAAGSADAPVTNVSWFAAEAYCKARGMRLPSTAQWEYALADAGRDQETVRARSLEWFAKPNGDGPGAIGGPANGYGVRDLVGLVWEWTYDFNAYAMNAESRDPNGKDSSAVCGGAAAGVADPSDYPAFMRTALRASLKANYTADNLGFRCVGASP